MDFLGSISLVHSIMALIAAMLLCVCVIAVASKASLSVGLVDKPDNRKLHNGNIPLVGGVSIFITFLLMQFFAHSTGSLIISGGLLVLIGIADDYRELSAVSRLAVQAFSAGILVIGGHYQIENIGSITSAEPVLITGIVAIIFSIFCVIGVINAINMIDGADGLAGGIIAISLCALIIAVLGAGGSYGQVQGLLVVLGAIVAFLLFNLGAFGDSRKIFLGDSGSMFLGILMAAYYIRFSQGEGSYITPVTAGWIFGLPLMDSISVMVGRVTRGELPVKAGRDHLHHRLVDSGISSPACVSIMLGAHAALVSIGVLGNYFGLPELPMFWLFVLLIIVHFFITPRIISKLTQSSVFEK